jgi:hypothetical protein
MRATGSLTSHKPYHRNFLQVSGQIMRLLKGSSWPRRCCCTMTLRRVEMCLQGRELLQHGSHCHHKEHQLNRNGFHTLRELVRSPYIIRYQSVSFDRVLTTGLWVAQFPYPLETRSDNVFAASCDRSIRYGF